MALFVTHEIDEFDPEEINKRLALLQLQCSLLQGGVFHGSSRMFQLKNMFITEGRNTIPIVAYGQFEEAYLCCAMLLCDCDDAIINGHKLHPKEDIILYKHHSPFVYKSPKNSHWIHLHIHRSLLDGWEEQQGDHTLVIRDSKIYNRLAPYLLKLLNEHEKLLPAELSALDVQDIENRLLVTLKSCLTQVKQRTCIKLKYTHLALKLLYYMDNQIEEALTTAEFCDHIHVSKSTLQRIFQKTLGLKSKELLRIYRLNLVRRALINSNPQKRSVSFLAFNFGFCHLGRFAKEYFAMFREYPSQTLARPKGSPLPEPSA